MKLITLSIICLYLADSVVSNTEERPKRHYGPELGKMPPQEKKPNINDEHGISVLLLDRGETMGERIPITDHPYVVNIFHKNDDMTTCGRCVGTVITPYLIITVATCLSDAITFDSETQKIITNDEISKDYIVRLNSKYCNQGGSLIWVQRIFVSPDSQHLPTAIALLQLKYPTSVKIVTLCPARFPEEKKSKNVVEYIDSPGSCRLVGWPVVPRRKYPFCHKTYLHKISSKRMGMDTQLASVKTTLEQWEKCSTFYNTTLDEIPNVLCSILYNEFQEPFPMNEGAPLLCGGVQWGMLINPHNCTRIEDPVVFVIPSIRIMYTKHEREFKYEFKTIED